MEEEGKMKVPGKPSGLSQNKQMQSVQLRGEGNRLTQLLNHFFN